MFEIENVPPYVTIVSVGSAALTHGHHDSYPRAVAWCARAMERYPHIEAAEQVVVARPTVDAFPQWGRVTTLVVIEGWRAHPAGWRRADSTTLQIRFDSFEGGPSTLEPERTHDPNQPPAIVVPFPPPRPKLELLSADLASGRVEDPVAGAINKLHGVLERIAESLSERK